MFNRIAWKFRSQEKKFERAVNRIAEQLQWEFSNTPATRGLCTYLTEFACIEARVWFDRKFSGHEDVLYVGRNFWLGPRDTKEGLETRLKFLKLFKEEALKTGEYKAWNIAPIYRYR